MAFIRKHRVVLVPLFVVAIAGLGLFFLLRSQSEEPVRNVSSAYPRETVQAWREDVSKRSQHGREYQFVRTVEYVDPETEEVVTEETGSAVRERATDVCYRDAAGDWRPTVAEWETGGLGFKMKENSWQIEVPLTLGSAYEYTVGGKTLAMRPSTIGLSDGQQSVVLGPIDTSVIGQIDPDDPSRLVFADVLGTNSGVDIELVLECASLHQNVVLRAKPRLPEGFDAENTRLYVYTELGLDALTAAGDVNVWVGDTPVDVSANDLVTARNTNEPITFTVERTVDGTPVEAPLHRFVASRVWDETGPENETVAARQLWRSPVDYKTYLVESLPYSYIADATGAVTLDYESQNGTIDEDETWTADATYYVTGDVVIGQDVTLTIEPGTVVKFAEDTSIKAGIYETESDAKIVAKGEPYSYIVFTSDTDDNCGEDLTPGESTSGTSSYYTLALEVGRYGDVTSEIEYCKAAFGMWGIVTSRQLNTPVAHCIVDDCWCGILVCRGNSTSPSDVFNCLVTDCYYGICAWMSDPTSQEFEIRNSTIADGCDYGIHIHFQDDDPYPTVHIKSNLITGCTEAGISTNDADWADDGTWYVTKNAFWDNPSGKDYENIPADPNRVTINLTISPYDTTKTQLGSFFIDITNVLNETDGSDLLDAGEGNAHDADLYGDGTASSNTLFEITAPEVINSDISTAGTTTWAKRTCDADTVDIGYHHPRVDKVINATRSVGGSEAVELKINPGVVIVFSGSTAQLKLNPYATGDVTLTCEGDRDNYIVMAGKPVVSMDIEAKRGGNTTSGSFFRSVPTAASVSITHCRFTGLYEAVRTVVTMTDEIKHCMFDRNLRGFYCSFVLSKSLSLRNCLFQNNTYGFKVLLGYGSGQDATLSNCTFDRSNRGIYYQHSASSGKTFTVKDCLFTKCTVGGIDVDEEQKPATWNEDYNAFWDCGANVQVNGSPAAIGADSIVLLKNPYDTGWIDWSDQWYLDQSGACIDAGSGVVQSTDPHIDLDTFTTSLDGKLDVATVDIGYHYPGPSGVSNVDLLDDQSQALTDVVFADDDPEDDEIIINVSFAESGTWYVYFDDNTGQNYEATGTGNISDLGLDLSELDEGVHTIRIEHSDSEVDDIVFTIVIDESGPSVLTIEWPKDGDTVGGI